MVKKIVSILGSLSLGLIFSLAIWQLILVVFEIDTDWFYYSSEGEFSWALIYLILPLGSSFLFFLVRSKIGRIAIKVVGFICIIWLVSTLFLISWNKTYWGYYLRRPSTFSEIKDQKKILAFNTVSNIDYSVKSGRKILSFSNVDYSLDSLDQERQGYYDLLTRGINNKDDFGNIKLNLTLKEISSIENQILHTELIDKRGAPENGLNGNSMIFSHDNSTYIFLGLKGVQVSNDHYPYYEFLFLKDGRDIELIKSTKFYYDLAGIEGLEFSTILPISAVLHFLLIIVGIGISEVYHYSKKT